MIKKQILFTILALLLSACSSSSSLYNRLEQVANRNRGFKCSAMSEIYQMTDTHMLTKSGVLYDINLGGVFSDTNENCRENIAFDGIKVSLIYPVDYKNYFSTMDGFAYENSKISSVNEEGDKLEVFSSIDDYNEVVKYGKDKFTGFLFDVTKLNTYEYPGGPAYIENGKVYFYEWGVYLPRTELSIFGLKENETINRITSFAVFSDKSAYVFSDIANNEDCKKYVDVKCVSGFRYSASASSMLNEFKEIVVYFDGLYIVTEDGSLYSIKSV